MNKVRRRVGAVVFGVVTLHAIIALIGLSRHYDDIGRDGDATGLLVMSGLLSIFQYVGVRLILGGHWYRRGSFSAPCRRPWASCCANGADAGRTGRPVGP